MTRYRRELNSTLVNLVNSIQPLMEKYERVTTGPQNEFSMNEAGRLSDKVSDCKSMAKESAVEARDGYLERLDRKVKSFSGGTIDNGDIQIINSPIMVMTPEEYDIMCQRYEGNRAMERLLIGYAEKHEEQAYKVHFMTDSQKQELAHSLYSELVGWIENGGNFGLRDFATTMAGDMFQQADLLKE